MSLTQGISDVRVIGSSDAIRRVELEALLASRGDATVLITGERGVGKAVLARFIHEHGHRSSRGFAVVSCEGVPDLLVESELFGHAQGSFAGAYRDKPGLLESVRGGTVFLDEVGALSLGMQARLLRYLETGEYTRIGGSHGAIHVHAGTDVRLIASTTENLGARVAAGSFLRELQARLNTVRIPVPPLRDRRADIPSLVDHYVGQFVGDALFFPLAPPEISGTVREALCRADWRGNVRELRSAVLRQLLITASRNRADAMLQTA